MVMSKCLEDIIPGEKAKASKALAALPKKVRGFYSPQYGVGIGNVAGTFIGFACKVCSKWQEYGHDDDCPVASL